jgi:4-carboxymuconolactone decarboxylase
MAEKTVYEYIPKFGELRDDMLFGDIWERTGISKRDRSLITCTLLASHYRTQELKGHMQRAIDNGVTKDELKEMIIHIAFYSGWPTAVNAGRVMMEVCGDDD